MDDDDIIIDGDESAQDVMLELIESACDQADSDEVVDALNQD